MKFERVNSTKVEFENGSSIDGIESVGIATRGSRSQYIFPSLKHFKWSDLDGKNLKMLVVETDEGIVVSGQDLDTKEVYIMHWKEK